MRKNVTERFVKNKYVDVDRSRKRTRSLKDHSRPSRNSIIYELSFIIDIVECEKND